MKGTCNLSYISLNNRPKAMVSFTIAINARVSALVINVVTMLYREAFYIIGPPKRVIIYP